jgi:hypothetical protein
MREISDFRFPIGDLQKKLMLREGHSKNRQSRQPPKQSEIGNRQSEME